ncbi:MAG TPA: GNAT family N-acetyltransferase [Bryobacteraceae bacterium]|jgi:ribosomal protein S18 acetylase RimI-like enzyme|nr:GNAT family N-acetyltransferase [Bryobacteraceae bacterium]
MQPFEAAEANLRAAMRCYARCTPLGEVREHPGLVLTSSGVNFSVFNSAMLTAPVKTPQELELRIATAKVYFRQRGLQWSFWVCVELLDSQTRRYLPDLFRRANLRMVAEPPGLVAEELAAPVRPLPDLDILPILDSRTRCDFALLSNQVFRLPMPIASAIYAPESTWNGPMTGYIGYLYGDPVSILATVVSDGVIGIYSVGTVGAYQRHGFAERLVRHAIEDQAPRNGSCRSALQSTEAGLRLYRKLGYRQATQFAIFVDESR